MGSGQESGKGVDRGLRWPLDIAVERSDGIPVLALAGRVGQGSALELAAALDGLIERSTPRVVLDFALVDYISSAGLEVVETAAGRCAAANGLLVLAGVTEPVRIALDLAGLLAHLAVEPSREQAIARARTSIEI